MHNLGPRDNLAILAVRRQNGPLVDVIDDLDAVVIARHLCGVRDFHVRIRPYGNGEAIRFNPLLADRLHIATQIGPEPLRAGLAYVCTLTEPCSLSLTHDSQSVEMRHQS